ncbi:MAG: outer membrane porin, OprD family [Alphaproteobacteria bacterium]|nr:outer membrane porin, OprD family [Alphaproteobacteria bacterium]
MPGVRTSRWVALAVAVATAGSGSGALAQGFQQALPIPSTEAKSLTAIERLFAPLPPPTLTLFPEARSALQDTPAFFRDSKVEINARSYYRDHVQNTPNRATLNEAWAAGGWATLETGRLFNLVSGGAVFQTSLPLYAPQNAGNTGLLLPDQQGYAVVGELYGKLHLSETHTFIAGRYSYDTPFLNGQDNRMTPNTFYGYALRGSLGDADTGPAFRYGGGYIAAMKPRDADVFTSMSRVAGANVDRGVGVGGGLFTWQRASLGVIEYYSQDIINILYGEGKYGVSLPYGIDAALALQYADQRATGANLLTGSYFSTGQFGARLQVGRDAGIVTMAYTVVNPGYAMQSPWSFNPFYTDALALSFQRAGENALQVGLSYDFSSLGLKGVAAATQYFRGWTAAPAAGAPLVEDEWDFNLEWRPDWKPISGLWLRARYGLARTTQNNSTTTQNEVRLILNYTVNLY